MIFYKQMYLSPLGEMSLVANESGLVGVWFLKQKYFEHGLEEGNLLFEKNDVLKETELLLELFESSFSFCWDKFSTTSLGLSANYSLRRIRYVWSDSKEVR